MKTNTRKLFPILHNPTFHERYRQCFKDPDKASLGWLALLFTILGTAVLALEHDSRLFEAISSKNTPWDRVTELSERCYTAAMKCLEADRYLWRHNVSTLQELLNLIYGIHHIHGQTWTLLGLAYHMALSIGCHVDAAAFSLDIVEAEECRRCWLGLTTLLCNQNMAVTGFDIYQSVFSSCVLPPPRCGMRKLSRDSQDRSRHRQASNPSGISFGNCTSIRYPRRSVTLSWLHDKTIRRPSTVWTRPSEPSWTP